LASDKGEGWKVRVVSLKLFVIAIISLALALTSVFYACTACDSLVSILRAIVDLKKNETVEENKPVQIPRSSHIYLSYSFKYAGYLVITFSATGGVYFYVGNGDYWVRYPTEGTVSLGRFIVPVIPGTTYVYIYNPSLLSGASVTITITCVY